MKKLISLLLISFFVVACDKHTVDKNSEIAVVNISEIVLTSPIVAEINTKLAEDIKPMQDTLRKKQAALVEQANTLKTSDASTQAKGDMMKNRDQLISQLTELQKKAKLKQQQAMIRIKHKLHTVMTEYNRSRNNQFKLMLEKRFVVYSDNNLNITPNIQRAFDHPS